MPVSPAGVTAASPASTSQCLEAVRHMILSGELLPGQQVRQAELAARLGVSRIPVREALATLQAEGVITHTPNAGFTVARFDSTDLAEIYLMRRLLETELLRSADLSRLDAGVLADLNRQLRDVAGEEVLWGRKHLNRTFHFTLFGLSPLTLVRDEVARLWNMSEFYRSLYAYDETTHQRIVDEHERMIAAVAAGDTDELVRAADDHRAAAERLLIQRLGPPRTGASRPRLM
jgi:DNA-binding GntR family transcriptional regulator